jgi:hypothetical protein
MPASTSTSAPTAKRCLSRRPATVAFFAPTARCLAHPFKSSATAVISSDEFLALETERFCGVPRIPATRSFPEVLNRPPSLKSLLRIPRRHSQRISLSVRADDAHRDNERERAISARVRGHENGARCRPTPVHADVGDAHHAHGHVHESAHRGGAHVRDVR